MVYLVSHCQNMNQYGIKKVILLFMSYECAQKGIINPDLWQINPTPDDWKIHLSLNDLLRLISPCWGSYWPELPVSEITTLWSLEERVQQHSLDLFATTGYVSSLYSSAPFLKWILTVWSPDAYFFLNKNRYKNTKAQGGKHYFVTYRCHFIHFKVYRSVLICRL